MNLCFVFNLSTIYPLMLHAISVSLSNSVNVAIQRLLCSMLFTVLGSLTGVSELSTFLLQTGF